MQSLSAFLHLEAIRGTAAAGLLRFYFLMSLTSGVKALVYLVLVE